MLLPRLTTKCGRLLKYISKNKTIVSLDQLYLGTFYSPHVDIEPYVDSDIFISEDYVDYVVQVDAIGDPKGIVSGTTQITRDPVGLVMASHAAQVIAHTAFGWPQIISLTMSALVAGLTVGGKAIGKTFAMNSATSIVHLVGRMIYWSNHIPDMLRKKKNRR